MGRNRKTRGLCPRSPIRRVAPRYAGPEAADLAGKHWQVKIGLDRRCACSPPRLGNANPLPSPVKQCECQIAMTENQGFTNGSGSRELPGLAVDRAWRCSKSRQCSREFGVSGCAGFGRIPLPLLAVRLARVIAEPGQPAANVYVAPAPVRLCARSLWYRVRSLVRSWPAISRRVCPCWRTAFSRTRCSRRRNAS